MKKIIFIFLTFSFIITPVFVFSQEIQYPPVPGAPTPTATTTFSEYVKWIFNFSIIIGGILVFLMFVLSGIDYLISGLFPERRILAKERATRSFFGLLILLSVYLILYTINPQLTILPLQPLTSTTTTLPTSTSTIATSTFQEIPIGTLVENILAKNISCFNYNMAGAGIAWIDLVNCRDNRIIISTADSAPFATTTFFPNTSTTELFGTTTIDAATYFYYSSTTKIYSTSTPFYYCYEYDSDGNKKELLKNHNHDRYDCQKKLLIAIQIKSQKLKDLSQELKDLTNIGCSASNCENGSCTTGSCGNPPCTSYCHCLGAPRNERVSCSGNDCPVGGSSNTGNDPCTNRSDIDKKREEIRQLINGGDPSDLYYSSSSDPAINPKFFTLLEGHRRLGDLKNNLDSNLNDLKEAEELMKSPYGDRLTLVEFLDLKDKSKEDITPAQFKGYDISLDYCRDINCTMADANGICIKCQLNPDRLCNRYVSSGDNATFYENKNYLEEETLTKEMCTVDPKKEKGIPLGLIPIGETFDEDEEFADKIIEVLNHIISEVLNEMKVAHDNSDSLYWLPEGNNTIAGCECSRVSNSMWTSWSCSCSCGSDCCYSKCDSCYCTTCGGNVCPFSDIDNRLASITNSLSDITYDLSRYTDLTEAINLLPGDPNKCTIFDILAISRQKLTQCFTGYETPQNIGMTKMRVFSSRIALDLVYLGILSNFPYPASTTVLNAYPFNSDKLTPAQKQICLTNRKSIDCQTIIRDLMDNYYCCEGK